MKLPTIQTIAGTAAFLVILPFLLLVACFRRRNPRELGLTPEHRSFEIARKFGPSNLAKVDALLAKVVEPEENVLGAVVFLANDVEQVEELVSLSNADRESLLRAAVVKEERG